MLVRHARSASPVNLLDPRLGRHAGEPRRQYQPIAPEMSVSPPLVLALSTRRGARRTRPPCCPNLNARHTSGPEARVAQALT
jgi:hypothetical protein